MKIQCGNSCRLICNVIRLIYETFLTYTEYFVQLDPQMDQDYGGNSKVKYLTAVTVEKLNLLLEELNVSAASKQVLCWKNYECIHWKCSESEYLTYLKMSLESY